MTKGKKETEMANVELGDRAKDRITGLTGIVIGITNWLYGCRRVVIQPEKAKDNQPAEPFNIDEPQVEVLAKGVIAPFQRAESSRKPPHGPRRDATRRPDVKR